MKKIKKLFFSLILFLFYANITNATTKGTYVVKENNTGKELLVGIGVALIVLVIILGYQLDKKDEIKKRRKRYDKAEDNSNNEDYEDDIQYLEDIKVENKNTVTDDTVKINYAELIKLENEVKQPDENETEEYYNYIKKEEVIEKEEPKSAMDSTMIINVPNKPFKEKEVVEETEDAYELDIDNDLELLELEKAIKAANIKRYTRKKKKEVKKVKKYTRKKVRIEPEVIIPKKKRGRPAKVKEEIVQVQKRGRGRPRKTEIEPVIEKKTKKRGRPTKVKKEEVIQTPKRGRGRPRKN